jgi:hypothetical protein
MTAQRSPAQPAPPSPGKPKLVKRKPGIYDHLTAAETRDKLHRSPWNCVNLLPDIGRVCSGAVEPVVLLFIHLHGKGGARGAKEQRENRTPTLSAKSIAQGTGFSQQMVREAVDSLIEKGLISPLSDVGSEYWEFAIDYEWLRIAPKAFVPRDSAFASRKPPASEGESEKKANSPARDAHRSSRETPAIAIAPEPQLLAEGCVAVIDDVEVSHALPIIVAYTKSTSDSGRTCVHFTSPASANGACSTDPQAVKTPDLNSPQEACKSETAAGDPVKPESAADAGPVSPDVVPKSKPAGCESLEPRVNHPAGGGNNGADNVLRGAAPFVSHPQWREFAAIFNCLHVPLKGGKVKAVDVVIPLTEQFASICLRKREDYGYGVAPLDLIEECAVERAARAVRNGEPVTSDLAMWAVLNANDAWKVKGPIVAQRARNDAVRRGGDDGHCVVCGKPYGDGPVIDRLCSECSARQLAMDEELRVLDGEIARQKHTRKRGTA